MKNLQEKAQQLLWGALELAQTFRVVTNYREGAVLYKTPPFTCPRLYFPEKGGGGGNIQQGGFL